MNAFRKKKEQLTLRPIFREYGLGEILLVEIEDPILYLNSLPGSLDVNMLACGKIADQFRKVRFLTEVRQWSSAAS